MAIKTFATGEVLTSSDTNTYLNNGGLVYISTTDFTTSATINFQSAFSSTYLNYRAVVRYAASSTISVYLRFLVGSTVQTDNIYSLYYGAATGGAWSGSDRSDQYGFFPAGYATYPTSFMVDFFSPQATDYTAYTINGVSGLSGTSAALAFVGGRNSVTTAINGFQLTTASSPTLTGKVILYGYRNA